MKKGECEPLHAPVNMRSDGIDSQASSYQWRLKINLAMHSKDFFLCFLILVENLFKPMD